MLRGLDYLRSAGVEPDERRLRGDRLVETDGTRTGAGRSTPSVPILASRSAFDVETERRQGQPLEHATRHARAGLVREVSFSKVGGKLERAEGADAAGGAGVAVAADELVAGHGGQLERRTLG